MQQRKHSYFFAIVLLLTAITSYSQGQMKLWYTQPAGDVWEAALPVGNGRLAAMVFGNTGKEYIKLNEGTVWSGSPNRNENPEALAALPQIRKLIFEKKYDEATRLAQKYIAAPRIHGMKFQPVGDLVLAFPGIDKVTDYYRELDIDSAVATTSFSIGGTRYKRKVFVSAPDQVIVVHLTADSDAAISFTASFASLHKSTVTTNAGHELRLTGITSDHEGVEGKIRFMSVAAIKTKGGTIVADGNTIRAERANEATIYISIATNYINYKDIRGNEAKKAAAYLAVATRKDFKKLLAAHVSAYQHYFRRVSLDLGITEAAKRPTDERLRDFAKGNDPQLVALYFQFGRYLLISSSQPGGQPANLQGIWNDKMNPPWDSKYTININTEMNYWPAEAGNLTEMHEPLVEMVKDLSQSGRQTARILYGANGWVAHHNTDLWRICGPVDGIHSAMWPMGGAWLSRHLWMKYLYGGDKKYLASVYPAMKGAAEFYLDFLIEEPEHKWLVVSPSSSPENGPKIANGKSITAGATMDNQIVFDLFSNVIHATEVLGTDKVFAEKLRAARLRLPPMQIGQYNQLQEWMYDYDNPNDKHRHVSHLFGLYPAGQVSAYRSPQLFMAAKQSLVYRGDVSTGWSMGWKVNWWARLLDGNRAYKLIRDQLSPLGTHNEGGGTYPNLFDAHPPFQIDGNFGCTAGITEMLLQCYDGAIHLLPALPDAWPAGSVRGLRAAGGFVITSMKWSNGRLVELVIKSTLGGNCRLRVPNMLKAAGGFALKEAAGENNNPFYKVDEIKAPLISPKATTLVPQLKETMLYDVETRRGGEYRLVAE